MITKLAVFFVCAVMAVGDAKMEASAGEKRGNEDLRIENRFLVKELERNAEKHAAKEAVMNEHLSAAKQEIEVLQAAKQENEVLHGEIRKLRGQKQESKTRTNRGSQEAAVESTSAKGSVLEKSAKLTAKCNATLQRFDLSMTWKNARNHCKSLGGDLASFPDTKQLLRAYKVLAAPSHGTWLGGDCDGNDAACDRGPTRTKQWYWLSGEEIPLNIPYWFHNRVQYEPVGGTCLDFVERGHKDNEILDAAPCSSKIPSFICQFISHGTS